MAERLTSRDTRRYVTAPELFAALAGKMVQAATTTISTDGSGNATLTFPTPFPNACDSFVITQAGNPATYGMLVARVSNTPGASSVTLRVYLPSGANAASIPNITVCYIAVGH